MEKIYEIVKIKKEVSVREDLAPLNAKSVYGVVSWLQNEIGYDTQENLVLLCLDVKNNVNCFSVVHRGTVSTSIVHPRDIFQRAILSNCSKIILAHNHPSGDCEPSKSDDKFTQKMRECGELFGIHLLDHLIVSEDEYFSYLEDERYLLNEC